MVLPNSIILYVSKITTVDMNPICEKVSKTCGCGFYASSLGIVWKEFNHKTPFPYSICYIAFCVYIYIYIYASEGNIWIWKGDGCNPRRKPRAT